MEPEQKAVGGPVLCKYSDGCASRHGTSLRSAEALKKEALGATAHLLGQGSALAPTDYLSHNTLWCFLLSFSALTPFLTTHTHTRSGSRGKTRQGDDGEGAFVLSGGCGC